MYVSAEVDDDDVLRELSDDDIKQEYESRFNVPDSSWMQIYDKRRACTREEFLTYIDTMIMDQTGRILP